MKTYPAEMTNYHPRWLELLADIETFRDYPEPHQVDRYVGRDFASGAAESSEDAT